VLVKTHFMIKSMLLEKVSRIQNGPKESMK